jgi:sugar lactone lactonase YvrE
MPGWTAKPPFRFEWAGRSGWRGRWGRTGAAVAVVLAVSCTGTERVPAPSPSWPGNTLAPVGPEGPEELALPDGFAPEGVAISEGRFYVGSINTGAVYAADLATGRGRVLVPGAKGRAAIGVAVDGRDRIFVAGGATGQAYVYDASTGQELRTYTLTSKETFVNDVVVTDDAAWFTDSFNPVLYRVGIAQGGALPGPDGVQALQVSGDISYESGINANGIEATPDGRTLLIVQSNTGRLFTVDTVSGKARAIDLSGERVTQGDGILLDGSTLYVIQNRQNTIAVIRLSNNLRTGTVIRRIADPRFDVPTTLDQHGAYLYAVNARFGVTAHPDTTYSVVRVLK